MRVLLTGASSFTGAWFARELATAGHAVTSIFRKAAPGEYEGVRALRVRCVADVTTPVFGVSFGDDRFLELAATGWDVLCHHAAEATDYRSPDFDALAAVAANTTRLPAVLEALASGRIIATGSLAEADEGRGADGEDDLLATNPYGLSKTLTWQTLRYYAHRHRVSLSKFVSANPFGPLEEARFTTYLARTWLSGGSAAVNTPDYVRDNIHVSLLARAYRSFVEQGGDRVSPGEYRETQGRFARRFADELAPRLGVECPLELRTQEDFSEPLVRTNSDLLDEAALGFDEGAAWDDLAEYYLAAHAKKEL